MSYTKFETNNSAWTNKQFTASPVTEGVRFDLAVSDPVDNNNNMKNVDVHVKFDDIDPGGEVNGSPITYQIHIILEEEVDTDVWSTVAETFGQAYGDLQDGARCVAKLIVQERNTSDEGQPFTITNGFKWYANDNPGDRFRLRVCAVEQDINGTAALVSANITAAYKLY